MAAYRLYFDILIAHEDDGYIATSPSYVGFDDEGEEYAPEFEGSTASAAQAALLHALADVVARGDVEEAEE
jgi:hypothetical protein